MKDVNFYNHSKAGKAAQRRMREKYTELELEQIRSRAGEKGGGMTNKKYGKEFYIRIGKMGVKARDERRRVI